MKKVPKQTVSYSRLPRFDEYVNSDIFSLDVVTIRTVSCERNGVYNNKPHKHSFYEFHYSFGGTLRFEFDNKTASVQKGHFIIIPPKTLHRVDTSSKFSKLVLGFDISVTSASADKRVFSTVLESLNSLVVSKGSEFMEAVIRRMFDKSLKNTVGYRQELAYLLKIMLLEAFDKAGGRNTAVRGDELEPYDERLQDSINFIKDNISLGITREVVAANVYLSIKQLDRIFIREKGVTLRHYIDEVKIKKISSYLVETDMLLSEIAEKMGFSSEYSLSRFFTAHVGVSPAKYRDKK